MPQIIAVLFEENKEDSYVAIRLDGPEESILFSKGPTFTKTMGPYPESYAQATFQRWHYLKVINPPAVALNRDALRNAVLHLLRRDDTYAEYCPDD
jgi:hypothetical protein